MKFWTLLLQVAKFMADYRRNCRPERFLFAAHFGMTYQNVGFGSYINTQLNYFILMHEKYNVDKYQFQIVIYNWVYETLESYFDDFARDTACPLFRNINSTEFEALRKNESFGLIYANGSLPISSNRSVIALHMAPLYWPRRSEVGKWCQSVGYDYCLSKKQIVTKALWQPKPPLKELLRTLWRNILDNKHRFLAVHIRRGSKIAGPSKEVNEVPVDQFVKKIQHVCQRLGPECPKTVYLMHDEEWVFPKLQTLLNTSFQVYNFWTLLNRSRITWDENLISDSASDPGNIHRAPRAGWAWRTKQVILEITIISMSNELICTYSSNICKLAAVLRGNHTSRIYSMDQPNWDPFWVQRLLLRLMHLRGCLRCSGSGNST